MSLYYSDGAREIWLGDCEEILPEIIAKHGRPKIVLTDPPYSEQTHARAKTGTLAKSLLADHFAATEPGMIRRVFTACSPETWIVSFLDYHHVLPLEIEPPEEFEFVRHGIWYKNNTGAPQFTGDRPGTGWEAIGFWHRTGVKKAWHGKGRDGVFCHDTERGPHPTTKPLGLIQELVRLFTDPGDLVLDPFAGSGTTLRAAKNLGRRAIGIEMEKKWCAVARQRLAQEVLI